MTFDNSSPPSTSTLTLVKQHLPILLLVGGLALAFIGLHVAATGLVVLAAVHVVGAGAAYGIRYRHLSRSRGEA